MILQYSTKCSDNFGTYCKFCKPFQWKPLLSIVKYFSGLNNVFPSVNKNGIRQKIGSDHYWIDLLFLIRAIEMKSSRSCNSSCSKNWTNQNLFWFKKITQGGVQNKSFWLYVVLSEMQACYICYIPS